jgi:hypothetical protein
VVVFESPDASVAGVFGRRYTNTGGALGVDFPISVYTTLAQSHPRVVASDSGFVVVWDSNQDGSALAVMARRYDAAGNPLTGEFQVNSWTTNIQSYPAISMAPDGSFVVVWQSYLQDGLRFGVFGQRYDASGAVVGAEFQVNTFTQNHQMKPSVGSMPDGGFVVTWHSYAQETGIGVRGQMFDPQGDPVSVEFAVNTTVAGNQSDPFVAVDANRGFVVAWRDNVQDGASNFGVFGQRYAGSDLIFVDGFEP